MTGRLMMAVAAGLCLSSGFARAGEDQFMFLTPSKNIGCRFTLDAEDKVYCVRRDPARSTPDVPLLNAWAELTNRGPARTGPYMGEAWYPEGAEILAYGKSRSEVGTICTSLRTGLICTRGKHGFAINRKTIRVY